LAKIPKALHKLSFNWREEEEIVCSSLEEFLNAKKLRTLQGANQNSSPRFHRGSSDSDLLGREGAVFIFWLKFPKLLTNYLLIGGRRGNSLFIA